MNSGLYLSFVAASLALLLLPGPNVAVIVASSLERGHAAGLWTVAGTSAAMLVQLSLVVAGLTALTVWFAEHFEWLRWAGVAYLAVLGLITWRSSDASTTDNGVIGGERHWLRGFLVSLTNPKTLLFYGAFMPQFVTADGDPALQLAMLAATFVVMAVVVDAGWALLAARARNALDMPARLRARITGGLLICAATGLALVRRA